MRLLQYEVAYTIHSCQIVWHAELNINACCIQVLLACLPFSLQYRYWSVLLLLTLLLFFFFVVHEYMLFSLFFLPSKDCGWKVACESADIRHCRLGWTVDLSILTTYTCVVCHLFNAEKFHLLHTVFKGTLKANISEGCTYREHLKHQYHRQQCFSDWDIRTRNDSGGNILVLAWCHSTSPVQLCH